MRNFSKFCCVGFIALVVGVAHCSWGNGGNVHRWPQAKHFQYPKAKNIIFMVPDGMGLSNVTAARIFKNGPDGAPLSFETLEHIGYQRTHSADSTVTDSAAAASAWACGEKYKNGEISCHNENADGNCDNVKPTVLELAKALGKSTGLVVTSQISHATPAAFGAHSFSRNCGSEIARQYIVETGVDVILGGGVSKTQDYCNVYEASFEPLDKRQYIIDLAKDHGYTLATTEDELNAAVGKGAQKLLGMFEQNGIGAGKTPENFWVNPAIVYPDSEPTLAEMTKVALDLLEDNKKGFFLVLEGSQIDWENHSNRTEGQIAETLAFDEAVREVLDWLDVQPFRTSQTLVIVAADHDCGGFAVNGPYGSLSVAGEIVEGAFTSTDHTAVDTIIWSQGPGSHMLDRAVDNTDLYDVMQSVLW